MCKNHLVPSTGCSIHRWSLLSFTKQWSFLMSTPKMLTWVWKLETSTERVALFKFHSALIIKTVLILYLLSYKCVVISLNEELKFLKLFMGECLMACINSDCNQFHVSKKCEYKCSDMMFSHLKYR